MISRFTLSACLALFGAQLSPLAVESDSKGWKSLFNGKNLDGWKVVIGRNALPDTNHLVQVHEGMVHMYKDAVEGSPQPAGYIVREFTASVRRAKRHDPANRRARPKEVGRSK